MLKGIVQKSIAATTILLFIGAGAVPNICADDVNYNKDDRTITSGSDLIAYWNFDEGNGDILHDSSGNENDGYINNCNWVSGYSGTALEFPYLDSMVYGIPDSMDDQIIDSFSIEAWIKWYGPGSYVNSYFFDCRCFYGGFFFYISNADHTLYFKYYANSENQPFITGISTIPLSTWTHIKAVFDNTAKSLSLYINEELDATIPISDHYGDSDLDGVVGNNIWAPGDGAWRPFNGIIDELKIWKSVGENLPKVAIIIGKTTNLSTQGDYITFEAIKTRVITFFPFNFNTYISGEKITISKDYRGFVGLRNIFALYELLI